MTPQDPAQGILLHRDYGKAMTYIVACDCGNGDCEHQVWIEAEDTGVTVCTYTTQKTDFWSEAVQPDCTIDDDVMRWYNWFWTGLWNGLVRRLKLSKDIWIHGYVKYEASLMMNEQQALNYAEVLKKAIDNVKEFRKP
jgi:uncharacterized protein YchJ